MTENEALEYIKNMAFMCGEYEKCEYGNQCTTKCLKATKMAIKSLEEIQQYRTIGTIDEFKDLKEKSIPRKIKGIRFEEAICPRCESELFDTYWAFGGIRYCSNCGQTIDWQ